MEMGRITPLRRDLRLPDRFWDKVEVRADGCWNWTASRNAKGYGYFSHWRGRNRLAYSVAYEELIGPVPEGFQLDHLCRNPACVNPAHLEPVTPQTNSLRGNTIAAANAAKTHCARGHAFKGANLRMRPDGSRACRACTNEDQRSCQARWRNGRTTAPAAA